MRFPALVFLLLLCRFYSPFSDATDTIKPGESISGQRTIFSAGGEYELGFFSPGSSKGYYVGIWYRKISVRTIVWVANREYPPFSSSSYLTINNEGNLVVVDGRMSITVTSISISSPVNTSTATATLLDSGNLILKDENSHILWQSFDYPSHTLLPGMRLGHNVKTGHKWSLTSWRGTTDPGPGDYSVELDPENWRQFSIFRGSQRYWTSGTWDGLMFSMMPEMRLNYIYNFSFVSNENETYLTYSLYVGSIISRLVMDLNGQIRQFSWLEDTQQWNLFWSQPRPQCDVKSLCGPFGSCNEQAMATCQCLQGFKPVSSEDRNLRTYNSGGCVRQSPLRCETSNPEMLEEDRFLQMDNVVRFPENNQSSAVGSADKCRSFCLNNCSCNAYTYISGLCFVWYGNLSNLQQLPEGQSAEQILYLRLSASELPQPRGKKILLGASIAGGVAVVVLLFSFYFCCQWRRRLKGKEGQTGQNLLLFNFDSSFATIGEHRDESNFRASESKDVELPLFSFSSVSVATDGFSAANKLGEGGFGPVYKGKLLKGQEIAVKRLSRRSGQGLEELKNETMLIAKLQHRNLVRLLGCCIEGEEKILIYEYMPNKSLDVFLFDPNKCEVLDWGKRARVIEGTAQGLLYLHHYSRLRIIHRDLKASNILLDSGMNPKISDFGMARIFGENKSVENTNRIVGTYGYMSPEYATEGLFSIKSDVFSFGVLMLEILSGKKNTGFYNSDSLNLLGYAWELWRSERGLELIDPMLGNPPSMSLSLRYINVALLCVQETAADRPTMSDVVLMLSNELVALPSPKQPANSTARSLTVVNSDASRPGICSINNVTVSMIEGR